MTPAVFEGLLCLIGPHIHKSGCNVRAPLPAGLRLAVTLRHLATDASYHDLMYDFRVAHNTLSGVIREVCKAIYEELSGDQSTKENGVLVLQLQRLFLICYVSCG